MGEADPWKCDLGLHDSHREIFFHWALDVVELTHEEEGAQLVLEVVEEVEPAFLDGVPGVEGVAACHGIFVVEGPYINHPHHPKIRQVAAGVWGEQKVAEVAWKEAADGFVVVGDDSVEAVASPWELEVPPAKVPYTDRDHNPRHRLVHLELEEALVAEAEHSVERLTILYLVAVVGVAAVQLGVQKGAVVEVLKGL